MALLAVGAAPSSELAAAVSETKAPIDAAILAWKAWRIAHRRMRALCRRQQRLETELIQTVGLPHVLIDVPEQSSPVRIGSLRQFDDLAAQMPSLNLRRADVVVALAAHQCRWDAADRAIGYSAALQDETLAANDEERLLEQLLATDATSLQGIAVKLDALIAIGSESDTTNDITWRHLRGVRRDLTRLAEQHQSRSTEPAR